MSDNSNLQPIDLKAVLEDYRSQTYLDNMLKGHKKDFEISYDQEALKKECQEISNMCNQISIDCKSFASVLQNFQSRQTKIKKSTETVKDTVNEVKMQVKDIQKKLQDAEEELSKHKSRYQQILEEEAERNVRPSQDILGGEKEA